ncbi:hypothetical protein [Alienimonas sp. DA493]|uniref:hypothetical protein n=1 Tax=Alienimonas sp. DA493 TaxID=3373605 RepID=UPI0037547AC4
MSDEPPTTKRDARRRPAVVQFLEELRPSDVIPRHPGRDRLLTTGEVAVLLNKSAENVRLMAQDGVLPSVQDGHRTKVWWSDVKAYCDRNYVAG